MKNAKTLSPESIDAGFREHGFVTTGDVATTLYLSEEFGKPVLLEGPAGVGKTEIGKLWARLHGAELVRLQCYEGLDEAKALYEWSYGKHKLYAQLLREKTPDLLSDAPDLHSAVQSLRGQADEFFSEEFLLARPLLRAIRGGRAVVLLIDEVDRADEEFEAFLLEVLSDGQVSIPEIGTLTAPSPPRVVLTSNDTRELSDALRRRCLYLHIDYPSPEEELARPGAEVIRGDVPFAGLLDALGDLHLAAPSDYGRAFHGLLRSTQCPVGRGTMLVVLGDGRSNRLDSQAWAFEEIAERCGTVIWMVPEAVSLWGTGDSALLDYLPAVDVAVDARDLEGLARGVAEIERLRSR